MKPEPTPIDYRNLLHRYVRHVTECEGISFIDRLNESMGSDMKFTPEEVAELELLDRIYPVLWRKRHKPSRCGGILREIAQTQGSHMKVKIKKMIEADSEIEVDFPLFLNGGDSLDGSATSWETYIRIDEDGSLWGLVITDHGGRQPKEYKFERGAVDIAGGRLGDYWRGDRLGTYSRSNKETFARAIEEARNELATVPT